MTDGERIDDVHPIDGPIGELNAIAIALAMRGQHPFALQVAIAVQKIEDWVISLPESGRKADEKQAGPHYRIENRRLKRID